MAEYEAARLANAVNVAGAVGKSLRDNSATITADSQILRDAQAYVRTVGDGGKLPVDAKIAEKQLKDAKERQGALRRAALVSGEIEQADRRAYAGGRGRAHALLSAPSVSVCNG